MFFIPRSYFVTCTRLKSWTKLPKKKKKKIIYIYSEKKEEEMVIIENIVEDSIEVKYKDESTTHNPQVLVDLLKMTIQYVDFLGVENFNFIINLVLSLE